MPLTFFLIGKILQSRRSTLISLHIGPHIGTSVPTSTHAAIAIVPVSKIKLKM